MVINASVIILKIAVWYNYALVVVLVPVGVFVFYKIFVRYKILTVGNNQIQINYPLLRRRKKYTLDQVTQWTEQKVSIGKRSTYQELQILFSDGTKLNVGHKEHTQYNRLIDYFNQKLAKRKTAPG